MNIPQMLSHRGSETHMNVINNAKDLRLKTTTGCSHEPRDGGSHELVLLQEVAGEGLGGAGLAPYPSSPPGVGEHHWGSQHQSAPQHSAGQPWLVRGGRGCSKELQQLGVLKVGVTEGRGLQGWIHWEARPGQSQQAHPDMSLFEELWAAGPCV